MLKLLIRLCFLAAFAAGAAWVEFKLVLLLGPEGSLLAAAAVLFGLFGMLARAPEGEEKTDGFYVRAGHRQSRCDRPIRSPRPLKLEMTRLFSSS
jgi:hypothetical protein